MQPASRHPRLMVLFRPQTPVAAVRRFFGMEVVAASDFRESAVRLEQVADSQVLYLDHTALALAPDSSEIASRLTAAVGQAANIMAVEPVRQVRGPGGRPEATATRERETWGLRAVGASRSRYTGRGIRVAILDSGLDLHHPDFSGRQMHCASFVPGESVQDTHGHGTHSTGTLAGPAAPVQGPRYGVAPDVDLFVGKVLRNVSSTTVGDDEWVHVGINWALANQCRIISMSLGSEVGKGESYSEVYEGVAAHALLAGTVLIAAAGNESHGQGARAPVNSPADCPSVMAIGATRQDDSITNRSNGSVNAWASVDLVGPGWEVYASTLIGQGTPLGYTYDYETSRSTPHVAGVAALWAEAEHSSGMALWGRLMQTAKRLNAPAVESGCGLVQAPY